VAENVCQVGVDSSYADANNCRGYTVCVAGEAFDYVCPGQLVFNPQLHFCDFDLHNTCPSRGKLFYLLLNKSQRTWKRSNSRSCNAHVIIYWKNNSVKLHLWNALIHYKNIYKKLIGRWDSERKLSLRRHRTRTTKYNRLVHKFRHR